MTRLRSADQPSGGHRRIRQQNATRSPSQAAVKEMQDRCAWTPTIEGWLVNAKAHADSLDQHQPSELLLLLVSKLACAYPHHRTQDPQISARDLLLSVLELEQRPSIPQAYVKANSSLQRDPQYAHQAVRMARSITSQIRARSSASRRSGSRSKQNAEPDQRTGGIAPRTQRMATATTAGGRRGPIHYVGGDMGDSGPPGAIRSFACLGRLWQTGGRIPTQRPEPATSAPQSFLRFHLADRTFQVAVKDTLDTKKQLHLRHLKYFSRIARHPGSAGRRSAAATSPAKNYRYRCRLRRPGTTNARSWKSPMCRSRTCP